MTLPVYWIYQTTNALIVLRMAKRIKLAMSISNGLPPCVFARRARALARPTSERRSSQYYARREAAVCAMAARLQQFVAPTHPWAG